MVITLGNSKAVFIDKEDSEKISEYHWSIHSTGCAEGQYWKDNKRYRIKLHRLIMNAPKGVEVDHINGNKLDNRKCNLRLCTREQNQHNVGITRANTSGFKGVYIEKMPYKDRVYTYWRAKIRSNGKSMSLGLFKNIEEAAHAYDEAAKKYHGEFVRLNYG